MQTNYPISRVEKNSATLKTLLLSALFLLVANTAFAQVVNYAFSQRNEAYIPLENPTVLATSTAITGTGAIYNRVFPLETGTIPFPFQFSGNSYTGLTIYSNGFISFGTNQTNTSSPISSGNSYAGVISAAGNDLNGMYHVEQNLFGEISYQVVGQAPNREFVIQWKHFRPYSSMATATYWDWNFQIRLKENNTIDIAYNFLISGTPTSGLPQVGLRGATSSDYNNRTSNGVTASNWNNSTAGTSSSSSMTTNSTSMPSGLVFNWVPPSPCIAPASQPTDIVLNMSGTTVSGSFTATTPASDRYLVVRTPTGTPATPPVNGTTYATGTGLGGNIISIGNSTTFTNSSLAGNTSYTYTVFAYNSACTGGPLYNTASPLIGNTTSCPNPPTLVTSSNASINSFTLNWTEPTGGYATDFHYQVEIATDNIFAQQIPGSPFSVSSNYTTYTAANLNNSTKYYYRIRAVSICNSAYSSVGNISTLCLAVTSLPYSEGFDDATLNTCWTTATVSGSTNWAPATNNDGVPSPKTGTRFAGKSYTNSSALLISPQFNLTQSSVQGARVSVWIYRNATNGHTSDVVKFFVNTTNSIANATQLISVGLKINQEPVVETAGWHNYKLAIPANYLSAPFHVIAQGITAGSNSSYGLGFDDFLLEEMTAENIPTSVEITTANNIPATIITNEGTLALNAAILPATASQNVVWSIANGTGSATISASGVVKATTNGTVTAKATSFDNPALSDEIEITISNQFAVAEVTVATQNNVPATITTNGGTLQLTAAISPSQANQAVTWTIANTSGQGTISTTGLVTGVSNGTVVAKATSVSNPALSGQITITISNQIPVYCTPSFPQGTEPITLVEFAGISNTTAASTSSPSYENYTTMTGNVVQGETYPIRLKGNTNGSYSGYFKVYADWNNNGVFEATEGYELGYVNSSTGIDDKELLGSITVPSNAAVGNTRMRVMKKFASQSIPACNLDSYGQAEDYTLIVAAAQVNVEVTVATQGNVPAAITANAGTLQLTASILPATVDQNVTWSVTSGNTIASVSQTGLVTAITNGSVTVRATSVFDTAKFGELVITITNQNVQFPFPYCNIGIEDSDPDYIEPITSVTFSNIANTSSAAIGATPVLEDFTNIIGNVAIGQTYPITVKGNTAGNFETNHIRVYIDWNQNGTFDSNESYAIGTIRGSNGVDAISVTANIAVPQNALLGNTRMRIVKDYEEDNTNACNDIYMGQAEDYTLNVQENLNVDDFAKNNFKVYPNPTSDIVNIQTSLEVKNIAVYNQIGQLIFSQKATQFDLSNVASGIYMIQIDFENGQKATKKIIKK